MTDRAKQPGRVVDDQHSTPASDSALSRAERNFTARFLILTGYLIGALTEYWVHGSVWVILAGVAIAVLLTMALTVAAVWRAER